jgi:hypothetical protein
MSMAQLSCVSRSHGARLDIEDRKLAPARTLRRCNVPEESVQTAADRADSLLSVQTPGINARLPRDRIIRRWTQMYADGEPLTAFICVHLRHLRIRPSVRTRRVNVRLLRARSSADERRWRTVDCFICVHLRHLRIRPSVRTRRVNVVQCETR